MAVATTQNQASRSGDTWRAVLAFLQDDGVTPASITGYVVRMQLRRLVYDPVAAASAVVAMDYVASTATLVLSAAATASLFGVYVYDVEVTDAAGGVSTPFAGTFTFTPDVTQ